MTWRSLSWFVCEYRRQVPPRQRAIRVAEPDAIRTALAICDGAFGSRFASENPSAINVAMLAVQTRYRPRIYTVRPSVSRLVAETDLHSTPPEPPGMLAEGGIIEARRPELGQRLFENVASLGWYHYAGKLYIVGLFYPDGIITSSWLPRWGEGDIADGAPAAIVGDREDHLAILDAALRYLITLGLLVEAEGAPLRVVIDAKDRSLADIYAGDNPRPPPDADLAVEPTPGAGAIPGLVLEPTRVRGHIKRQRHGAGGALRKWVYVSSYAARRWFDPRFRVESSSSKE
jgi:hypothetical protein